MSNPFTSTSELAKRTESNQQTHKEERISKSFSLSVLPSGHLLDVDESLHVLSRLVLLPSGYPHLVAHQQFTEYEWLVLVVLMEAHPLHASYVQLLAALTEYSIEEIHAQLRAARREGNDAVKKLLRPIRDALSTMYPKLKALSLRIVAVQTLGYLLASCDDDTNP